MARAIIGGLIADGYQADSIGACDIDAEKLRELTERFAVHTSTDSCSAVRQSDIVVLAIKPQQIQAVATALSSDLGAPQPLVISIAAGIPLASLAAWLGAEVPIVRVMPNTPALVGSGAAALIANKRVNAEQREQAEAIVRAVGLTVWVDTEALMDTVTALSGSGPAYVFLLMEALEQAGTALGLPAEQARILTLQTVMGAAKLALEADVPPATLRQQVTSPGGTTERALAVLEEAGLRDIFERALAAAKARSTELADEFGGT